MRVGVYVDGFNLYYGGVNMVGASATGWKWLDLRALSQSLASAHWAGSMVERVVYCTARMDSDPGRATRMDQYLRALRGSGRVDATPEGNFVTRAKEHRMATADRASGRVKTIYQLPADEVWPADAPVRSMPARGERPPAELATVEVNEEKGSDVNVATHLLFDVLTGAVDAAIVISNDTDLAEPINLMRARVPVGTVNGRGNYTAGKLRGSPSDGVGSHWWYRVTADDLLNHQLPNPCAGVSRPPGW